MEHYKLKNIRFFKSIYKNGKNNLLKSKSKNVTNIKDLFQKKIDIDKIVVSNKVSSGKKAFKYFICYKDAKIRPLCIFLPEMSAYRRDFDETKYMSFLIKNDELEEHNEIRENVKNRSQHIMKNI